MSQADDDKKLEGSDGVSRRRFLKTTLAGTPGAGAVQFSASEAHARRAWDHKADVVVVGSGAAGLSAAAVAADGGADVLILEKGGSGDSRSIRSGFGYCFQRLADAGGQHDPGQQVRTAVRQLPSRLD